MEYTENLKLFKYNPETDGKQVFSIDQALNYNWDILEQTVYKNKEDILNITDKMMPDYENGIQSVYNTWVTVSQNSYVVCGMTLRGNSYNMIMLKLKTPQGNLIPTASVADTGWIDVHQALRSDGYRMLHAWVPKDFSFYFETSGTESIGVKIYPLKGALQ